MEIPFTQPDITNEEIAEVTKVLESGWITTGPKTKEFEEKIAQYCGTEKAVCLNSATACMELTLRILGIGEGDEVIIPAYTYTATASAVCHVGAKLVMVDTKKDSFEMDYEKLADLITEYTKVIIPVEIAGVLSDYDMLYKIVEDKKKLFKPKNEIQKDIGRIIIMSDSAHAFGAFFVNSKSEKIMCGNIADFTCFSFHAVKNLTTAEGGAVTWRNIFNIDNNDIYKKYMLLSLHGQSKDALEKSQKGSWDYDVVAPYYKCNMTDIAAAIGICQLNRYDTLLNNRNYIVKKYDKFIDKWNEKNKIKILRLNHSEPGKSSSFHLYIIRIMGINEQQRNNIIQYMAENGICLNVHFKPLPMLTAYYNLGFHIREYPNAKGLYENEITLPLSSKMTIVEIEYLINNLFEAINKFTQI